ncbi:MAG: hypothetical protein ACYDAQ_16650 [Mycobacteriales bacterium]
MLTCTNPDDGRRPHCDVTGAQNMPALLYPGQARLEIGQRGESGMLLR